MLASLTKSRPSQSVGCRSCGSAYPASEIAYFKRVYGSDHLHQLHDDHQEEAVYRYARPERLNELKCILNRNSHLTCENDAHMTVPGRSAYSLSQLRENLSLYERKQCRSLRWNQHYQQALISVRDDMLSLLNGNTLQPMAIHSVAASEPILRNLDKNAGYMVFETGQRSKGENIEEAVKWCESNLDLVLERAHFNLPLVISHRSSNSKPTSDSTWKWRCRIILMQDIRHLLYDGVFAVPFTELFKDIPWGEGGMTQSEVRGWIAINRRHYERFYSSDYSKFDVSQAPWLLEDVMMQVVRPCFGRLKPEHEKLFKVMVNSYIHKEIHGFDRIYHAHGCQISGALTTYAYNTIINEIIDRTVLLMQGCDLKNFKSLKCGDDNLTFYRSKEPWNRVKHCTLIEKYFGIKTTLTKDDCGDSLKDNPVFLSREWSDDGEYRPIREVLFNLVYPERFRDYRPESTHVSVKRAEALVILSSCLEQDATMREYFDVPKIYEDAQIRRGDLKQVYTALAAAGSGFRTPWLNFKFGNLKSTG